MLIIQCENDEFLCVNFQKYYDFGQEFYHNKVLFLQVFKIKCAQNSLQDILFWILKIV